MTSAQRSIESILDAAVEIASETERRRFVEQACAGDADLKRQVEELIDNYVRAGDFLEAPAGGLSRTSPSLLQTAQPGTMIGPYKLLEEIGEGGFGVVFMAEQLQPVRRKVALKLLKPGMDSRQVIARFEAERQALALMDHPHIARVFDGGETAGGRPYFVMELVRGAPLTEFCDQQQRSVRERMELFLEVCQAVQHAHQKGIIHRDLKPSNVLVTLHDGRPVVKVIDFGIAKALGQQLTEKTLFTNFAQILGTPLYMSPEQAQLSGLDVDTRSDIYALGVLLYELLTGTTPFDRERLQTVGYDEIRRIIREEEPPKPSTRITTLGQAASTISMQRQSDPRRLRQLIRGELDWIVMKCLEKDRNRRYETASALAADLERYLHDERVHACPPTIGYRLRKFARRNKHALVTLAALGVLLVTAVVGLAIGLVTVNRAWDSTRQALHAEQDALAAEARRRTQAQDALDAMTSLMLGDVLARQPALTEEHKQFLARALQAYEEFAAETAETESSRYGAARALANVARIRQRLSPGEEAASTCRQAIARFAQLVADFPAQSQYRRDLVNAQINLGRALADMTRPQEARAAFSAALALAEQLVADHPDQSELQRDLAFALFFLGDHGQLPAQEVARHFQRAIALLQPLVERSPEVQDYRVLLARTEIDLSGALAALGQPQEALAAARKATDLFRQLLAESPANMEYRLGMAKTYNGLANRLRRGGRPEEIEKAYRDAVSILRPLAAEYPAVSYPRLDLSITLSNLALLLKENGHVPEAEAMYHDALALTKRLAEDYPTVSDHRYMHAVVLSHLADLCMETGRQAEAEKYLGETLLIRKQLLADSPGSDRLQNAVAHILLGLADLRRHQKQLRASCELLQEALPYHQAALKINARNPAYRLDFTTNRQILAANLLDLGDYPAAAAAVNESLTAAPDARAVNYQATGFLARCAALAGQDQKLTAESRNRTVEDYARRAVERLREAVRAGFRDGKKIQTDGDLATLRSRADFQELLTEIQTRK
jgi:serine/threonine protein kinase/tetratricopeptide (TPR) repeat protein